MDNTCFTLCFTIPGRPSSCARARFVPGLARRPFEPARNRSAKGWIRDCWDDACAGREPWEGPVRLVLDCRFARPKEWWPGRQHTGAPDLDNLAKQVLDALNGVAWKDDRQVVEQLLRKGYGDPERTKVTLELHRPVEKPPRHQWARHACSVCGVARETAKLDPFRNWCLGPTQAPDPLATALGADLPGQLVLPEGSPRG